MLTFVQNVLILSKKGHIIQLLRKGEENMKELLSEIAQLVTDEIENVEGIEFVDDEMGDMFYIVMKDGKKVLLSLVESKL